jgi:hypothetical protein
MKKKVKELKLGELMGQGWEIYKANFKLFLGIIAIIYIPINLILNLLMPAGEIQTFQSVRLYANLVQILDLVLGIVATMAIAYAVHQIIKKKKTPKLWESLKNSLLVWDKGILTSILAGLIIIGLLLLFIVPGVIYSVYYTFFLYLIIIKKLKYKKALDYSKSLVKGRWWRVLGISVVVTLAVVLAGIVISIPLAFFDTFIINVISDTIIDLIMAVRDVILIVFCINLIDIKESS